MRMLRALRVRAVALLWTGQVLSAIGDEVFRVAVIWLVVGMVGADAGYLASAQSGALLALCLVGGRWADGWHRRRTMIAVDAVRAVVVLVPVVAHLFGKDGLPLLVATAVVLSGLGAFFDPALQATLPAVCPDEESLGAATGLMSLTGRLSRAVGPSLIGLLASVVPMIGFFVVDSASFVISALSVSRLPPETDAERAAVPREPSDGVFADFRTASRAPLMRRLLAARFVVGGLWGAAFSLGIALLVQRLAPGDARAFGWTVACYGAGNVIGSLWVGNARRRDPIAILRGGYLVLGIGLTAMAAAPSLGWLGAAAVLAAIGGPVNDVPFVDLAQRLFPVEDLPKIIRLRMAVETAASLAVLAAAPALVRRFSAPAFVAACGLGVAAVGALGFGRDAALTRRVDSGSMKR